MSSILVFELNMQCLVVYFLFIIATADAPSSTSSSPELLDPPSSVLTALYSPSTSPLFVRECVSACREVSGSVTPITQMLVAASRGSRTFTKTLLEELMKQYKTVNAGELKNLSQLLNDVLCLEDPLQEKRARFIVFEEESGLLNLVRETQDTDSCRAYQCIKTLVSASNKSALVRDMLLRDADRWQWCVNWLKSKMAAELGVRPFSPASSVDAYMSNEDSSTRTFHRTTSAQVTLEEANALLAEFGASSARDDDEDDDKRMETDEQQQQDLDELPDLEEVEKR